MFDKIIVGYDGFEGGKDAVALAMAVASEDAEIVLVNVFPYEEYPNRAVARDFERAMAKEAKQLLDEAAKAFSNVRTHAEPGPSPGAAIRRYAEKEKASLIVVGSDHHGKIGRVLMGDNAADAMHRATCPVLVAPKGYRDRDSVAEPATH